MVKKSSITDIIKNDFYVASFFVKEVMEGAFRGTYTPFLLSTSIRQFIDEGCNMQKSLAHIVANNMAQAVSFAAIHIPLANYVFQQGKGKEYCGVLIASNVIDYFTHVYKRSRK